MSSNAVVQALHPRPLVMAHYMPWYESKPVSGRWGWHWTMNGFNPDERDADGKQQLASAFRPLIGAYDSSDPDLLECHTLQMKMAGIDGVFIDWYGTQALHDYAMLHINTQRMIDACSAAGLMFSILMEDQMVPQLLKAGICSADNYAISALDWLKSEWFKLPGYLHWNGRPVLLLFGPQFYDDAAMNRLFGEDIALFTLLGKRGAAVGAFGWPAPQVGEKKSWIELQLFYERAKSWGVSIAPAYPRFQDIYKLGGVGPGYGEIGDHDGETLRKSFSLAVASGTPFIQLASWNDWGEGTQIEPSEEFGYRDLDLLQERRRAEDPSFLYTPADLRVPAELYRLRKEGALCLKSGHAVRDRGITNRTRAMAIRRSAN
jgi:hypothetical protein